MTSKRVFDVIVSAVALLALAPVLCLLALAIKINSPGPIFFKQERVGQGGHIFKIIKFRSMVVSQPDSSLQITARDDPRITSIGKWLRHYKLDELPQLFNVLKGDMSIVGPRPEVPRYVEKYPANLKALLLSARPGITDLAAIEFRNEEELLAAATNKEQMYIEEILPRKIAFYRAYIENQSMTGDVKIVLKTILAILR